MTSNVNYINTENINMKRFVPLKLEISDVFNIKIKYISIYNKVHWMSIMYIHLFIFLL